MIIGHIGARKGSKGVPGKNMKEICGKPLIEWSIEHLKNNGKIDGFTVSTDCSEILEFALSKGAIDIGMRSRELSGDNCSKWKVWQDSLTKLKSINIKTDIMVDLDCTNPLREDKDITNAINIYIKEEADLVISCANARKNPYFNLLEYNDTGYLDVSKKLEKAVVARQAAPVVLEHVASTYVISPKYLENNSFLYGGKVLPYMMNEEKSYDIDSMIDFKIVELLLSERS